MTQASRWLITINGEAAEGALEPSEWDPAGEGGLGRVLFAVWQKERGHVAADGAQGNLHFQLYLGLTRSVRLSICKAMHYTLGGAHFEKRMGSHEDAVAYCSKEETRVSPFTYYWHVDEPDDPDAAQLLIEAMGRAAQGARNDLKGATQMIDAGSSNKEVAEANPTVYVKYHRGLNAYRSTTGAFQVRNADAELSVTCIVGPPGTGKTYWMQQEHPSVPGVCYWKGAGKWWPDYQGEGTICFNDFDSSFMTLRELKRLLDTGAMSVETKGGSVQIRAHTFVFTMNQHPRHLFPNVLNRVWDNSNPLWRRFRLIRLFNEVYVHPAGAPRVDEAMEWDEANFPRLEEAPVLVAPQDAFYPNAGPPNRRFRGQI